ncbi:MAG: hypothetical protein DHS20C15_22930 [Planctomycetota bacterium]|nr:MAG: hypothetical protein DHS20C15_22930 [Planctomycetota bacterium]
MSDSAPLSPPAAPRVVEGLPGDSPVLVLAPHPDDESLGCGATLALHAEAGHAVHAVFLTSGVHGAPGGAADPQAYIATRRAEAEAAAQQLGLASTSFWGLPDSMVVTQADLHAVVERLVALLDELRPALVYAPHAGEQHSDHHFVALAIERAAKRAAQTPRVLGYEVWSPLVADLVVDVTAVYARKLAAVDCYVSQLEHTDLRGAVEGMNRYRAILLPDAPADGSWRAEAFKELS